MLYYVRTGDISVSLEAISHFDAARKVASSDLECGLLMVVSDREIDGDNEENVYFLTENLAGNMRMVV